MMLQGGRTCLHLAAAYGHESIVDYLTEAGFDINLATMVSIQCIM